MRNKRFSNTFNGNSLMQVKFDSTVYINRLVGVYFYDWYICKKQKSWESMIKLLFSIVVREIITISEPEHKEEIKDLATR